MPAQRQGGLQLSQGWEVRHALGVWCGRALGLSGPLP